MLQEVPDPLALLHLRVLGLVHIADPQFTMHLVYLTPS